MASRLIMDKQRFSLTIERLSQQIVEDYHHKEEVLLVGIQPRGVKLMNRIVSTLENTEKSFNILTGELDITFYRDDFRRREDPIRANMTKMDFIIEGRHVVLVDDVLYTGRSVQAALASLQHYGRPASVRLMTLIDRRFNRHLPIQSDYIGLRVDALDEAYVKVAWDNGTGDETVRLYSDKPKEKRK